MRNEKDYNGFWKKLGHTLAIPALVVIIASILGMCYLFYLVLQVWLEFIK